MTPLRDQLGEGIASHPAEAKTVTREARPYEPLLAGAERTRRGAIVLPDSGGGAGPLYWAVLGVG